MELIRFLKNNRLRIFILILGILIASYSVHSYNRKYDKTVKRIECVDEKCDLTLKVISYPTFSDGKTRVICEILKCPDKSLTGTKTRMSIKNPNNREIRPNDILNFKAELTAADENALPGAFSYREYLKSINVCSQCYVEYKNIRISEGKKDFNSEIYEIRNNFINRCDQYFQGENAGLIKAVTTGDRTGIGSKTEENLKIAGVYHIVAISGLHLNIFIGYIISVMSKLRIRRFVKAVLSAVVCLLCAIFVLIFTGNGVSVIRAFSMLVVMLIATLISREYNSKNSLLISAIVIIIFTPYNIFNTAFRLSFLSTLGVLLSGDIMRYLKEKEVVRGKVAQSLCPVIITSFLTTLLTIPVTVNSFGYIPVLSWLANLVILPVMGPLIGCAVIFAVASGFELEFIAKLLSYICNALSEWVITVANFIASFDFAAVSIYPIQAFVILITCVICIAGIYVTRKYSHTRGICLVLILAVISVAGLKYAQSEKPLTVHYANVGQGDGAFIITPDNTAVLIDCGQQYPDEFLTENVISFLNSKNISSVDLAFVSHFHTDHISTLAELAGMGKIKNLAIPAYYNKAEEGISDELENLLRCAAIGKTKLIYVKKGTVLNIDGLNFKVLSPAGNMFFENNNNLSAVIKMSYGKNSFVFTGDIEADAMKYIYHSEIDCDVLKIAHHGSKTGAVRDFFDKTSPEYAVISCGKNNSYGHPAPEVLKLLEERNISVFRTDTDGGITFILNKENIIKTETMR